MIMGYDMYRNLTNTSGKAKNKNKKQQQTFIEALVSPGPDVVRELDLILRKTVKCCT